jgi:YidC/Oxa1 family membrane protein insertase
MDNQRLLVWAAFGLLAWLTYQQWLQEQTPAPQDAEAPPGIEQPTPEGEVPDDSDVPALPDASGISPEAAPGLSVAEADGPAAAIIRVHTDVYEIEIDTRGGTIRHATLLNYPVAKDQPETLVELLSPEKSRLGLIQSGLNAREDEREANHLSTYTSDRTDYILGDEDALIVPLTWSDGQGITVRKEYRFMRGSYEIGLRHTVTNLSNTDWSGAAYAQIRRRSYAIKRTMFNVDTYSFDGPVVYDGEKSQKLKRDDLISDGPFTLTVANGWVATIQHHFLAAIVPLAGSNVSFRVQQQDDTVVASTIGNAQRVAPGSQTVFEATLFVGPKLQDQLADVTKSLKLTVDYGWLTILSQPLFWLLSVIHDVVKNWGVAIIIVTILIKLAFYKLTQASGRSMAKMRTIQPRMKALQERYKDDRQQLSQAMMELYKREKVNPAAGCLPILIQMPFFLAFYWVLLESVEMRQAPFALWITDLSSRDPYFILPIIMGAAMLFQTKLNPAPADPVQAKVMQIMPIVFTGFFAFFPSGLVLYWVTNTILSIAQQWRINQIVEEESRKAKK